MARQRSSSAAGRARRRPRAAARGHPGRRPRRAAGPAARRRRPARPPRSAAPRPAPAPARRPAPAGTPSALKAGAPPRSASGPTRGCPSAAGSSRSGVDLAVADHPDRRRGRGGQLVEAVVPPEDQRPPPRAGQDARHHGGHARVGAADRRGDRPRRVGERAQEVEDGGDAHLPPRPAGEAACPGGTPARRRSRCRPPATQRATAARAGRWRRPAPRGRRRHPRTTTPPGRRAWRRAPRRRRRRPPPSWRC